MSLATTPFTLLWEKFASGAWYWKWTPAHQRAGTLILLLAKVASGAWHRKLQAGGLLSLAELCCISNFKLLSRTLRLPSKL